MRAIGSIPEIFFALSLLSGCASTTAIPVKAGDRTTQGIRVYDKKPLLFVYETGSSIEYVTNYNRGYALRFTAFLAKNDVKTSYENGSLTALDTNLDSTDALKLIQAIAEKAIDALKPGGPATSAAPPAAGALLAVYDFEFSETGDFVRLRQIDPGFPKPPAPVKVVSTGTGTAKDAGASAPGSSNKS